MKDIIMLSMQTNVSVRVGFSTGFFILLIKTFSMSYVYKILTIRGKQLVA